MWSEIIATRCTARLNDNQAPAVINGVASGRSRIATRSDRRSVVVGVEAVDVGFAVAVAADQLGAQCVEAIEPIAPIGGHPRLELTEGRGDSDANSASSSCFNRPKP